MAFQHLLGSPAVLIIAQKMQEQPLSNRLVFGVLRQNHLHVAVKKKFVVLQLVGSQSKAPHVHPAVVHQQIVIHTRPEQLRRAIVARTHVARDGSTSCVTSAGQPEIDKLQDVSDTRTMF